MNEINPYDSPSTGLAQDSKPQTQTAQSRKQLFIYSYCTSLAVAITVVVIWLFFMFTDSSVPQSQRRIRPPDVLQSIFLFATTLPSVLTCGLFSGFYCSVFKVGERLRIWPAILFGSLSGVVFNAMTAIWVIEHFFDW